MMINPPINGGYGCVDIPGFNGDMIRLFTRSKYSHAYIVLDAKKDLVLEAGKDGAKITTALYNYRRMDSIHSTDAVLGGSTTALMQAAQMYVGIPYGFLDIAYLGLELGPGWRPQWLLNEVLREDAMICSQLVAAFGVRYLANSWKCGAEYAQLVTPGMLAERARAL